MQSWILLFSCNLMWALQFTCIKLVQDQVGPLLTVWAPMTLATLLLYPFVRAERTDYRAKSTRNKTDTLRFFLLALVGIFPGQVLITWGTRMSLATNAAILMSTLPISTAIFAAIILGERMTRMRWLSYGAAIVGVLMCSGADFRGLNLGVAYFWGNTLVFFGTLGSAFYNTFGKKVMERYTPLEILFYSYLAMFFVMTPLVFILERHAFSQVWNFTLRTWTGLILLTIFHNFLAMVLFLKALKVLAAIQAALSNYLLTAFGVLISAVWLGEKPSSLTIIGGILIVSSTVLVTLREARTSRFQGLTVLQTAAREPRIHNEPFEE